MLTIPNAPFVKARDKQSDRLRAMSAMSGMDVGTPDGAQPTMEWAPGIKKDIHHKLTVIDDLDLILALVGSNSNLVAYHLVKGQWHGEKIPNTKGCHDFTFGWRNRKLHVIAAVNTTLYLFELEKMDLQGTFQFALKKVK